MTCHGRKMGERKASGPPRDVTLNAVSFSWPHGSPPAKGYFSEVNGHSAYAASKSFTSSTIDHSFTSDMEKCLKFCTS